MWQSRHELRALDIYQLAFNLMALAILLIHGGSLALLVVNIAMVAFIGAVVPRLAKEASGPARALYDFYFLPAFMFYYLETSALHSALYGSFTLDDVLARTDSALFGVQPSLVLAEAMDAPWLGELLSLAYLAFYPLVIGAGLLRLRRGIEERAYHRLVNAMAVMFASCYLLFTLVPTAGPRYYWHAEASAIPGFAGAKLLELMLAWAERPTGAFPSTHVAFAIVLACWAKRFTPWAFAPMAVLAATIAIATVYVRAHYAVDVLAGVVYGLAMWRLAEPARALVERHVAAYTKHRSTYGQRTSP